MPKTAQKDASVATVKKQGAVMKHIKKYWQWYVWRQHRAADQQLHRGSA